MMLSPPPVTTALPPRFVTTSPSNNVAQTRYHPSCYHPRYLLKSAGGNKVVTRGNPPFSTYCYHLLNEREKNRESGKIPGFACVRGGGYR